jgi:hypothetical protein
MLTIRNVALFLQDRLASAHFPTDWDSAFADADKHAVLVSTSSTQLQQQQQQQPYWLEPSAATLQCICELLQLLSSAVFSTLQQGTNSSAVGTNTATTAATAVQYSVSEQSSIAADSVADRSNSDDSSSSSDHVAHSELDKLILCALLTSCLRVLRVNLYYLTRYVQWIYYIDMDII